MHIQWAVPNSNAEMIEDQIQHLRSRSTELLIREEWSESILICTQLISLCQTQIPNHNPDLLSKLHKTLALAYSNRADAWAKLKNIDAALSDCDSALKMDSTHFKTSMCKGRILLGLQKYLLASDCFKLGLLDSQANGNAEEVNGYLDKCKRLDLLSKSGVIDLSSWVLSGFKGRVPELGEFIGPVEIRKSDVSGRGLYATRNVEVGGVLLVTEAVAVARGFVPELSENGQLVIWSGFVEKVMTCVENCSQIRGLVSFLSSGEDEDQLEVPDIDMHRPESELRGVTEVRKIEKSKILNFLDVNSMVEGVAPAKVLGTNGGLYGVGLWLLPSYVNHSCCPNARRLHVGDHVIVVASRDIKAGEELTFAYFDVFAPFLKRREMLGAWGFGCRCRRCEFEETASWKTVMSEIEIGLDKGLEAGNAVFKLEESMKEWNVKGKEKGFCRASFWSAYVGTYGCERMVRKWGRRIPPKEVVVESVADAVGSDERIVAMAVEGLKHGAAYGGSAMVDMERGFRLGRGVFGKTMKKQAMKSLLQLGLRER